MHTYIRYTKDFIHKQFQREGSGHDYWHLIRVWNMAKHIGKKERADMLVVELAALLHDLADRKFNDGDLHKGKEKVKAFLSSLNVDGKIIDHVCEIVSTCSYASSFTTNGKRKKMNTLEGMIVQDADRLDAIGAIGIARTFAYGGSKGTPIFVPEIKPSIHTSTKQYINSKSHTINHFYEKLLLLKDLMNTASAKKIAQHRHAYLTSFLQEFSAEWEGKC